MPPRRETRRDDLVNERFDLVMRIEKLLLRRDLLGEWTPAMRLEYAELCERERELINAFAARRLMTI